MTTECTSEKIGLVLKGENTLPVVLHADDDPAILLCLVVERLGEGADHLLGRDPVHPLGVDAHEVLAAAGYDVGLEPVVTQILQDFLHRLIRQLSVEPVPARMLGGRDIPGIWLISHLLDESQRWPALRGRRSTMAVGPGRGSGRPALRPAGPRYGGV